MLRQAEGIEHTAVVGPFGYRVCPVAERVRGEDKAMAAAPAESTCSHSGIFTCGAARLTTAITSGARVSRSRSAAMCSGLASGIWRGRLRRWLLPRPAAPRPQKR